MKVFVSFAYYDDDFEAVRTMGNLVLDLSRPIANHADVRAVEKIINEDRVGGHAALLYWKELDHDNPKEGTL